MEHRALGQSALEVSVVGLGCNNFGKRIDKAASTAVVHAALDAGINHFDTSESYGGGDSEVPEGSRLAFSPYFAQRCRGRVEVVAWASGARRRPRLSDPG